MINITWFENESDLQELTGLSHEQLWDAGFDLDDWDFGFRVSEKQHNGDGKVYLGDLQESTNFSLMYMLVNSNFKEPKYIEYNGWHYYMSYHA